MSIKPCKERIKPACRRRLAHIRRLYVAEATGEELPLEFVEDYGRSLAEYGAGIWLVEAGTWPDQREDYVRYQLTHGGPSEEFRVYRNKDVEFWLSDWYDAAKVDVVGEDAELVLKIVEDAFPSFCIKT